MIQRRTQKPGRYDAVWLVHAAGAAVLLIASVAAYVGVLEPAQRAIAAQRERERQAALDSADLKVLQDNTQSLDRLARSLEGKLTDTVELRSVDQLNKQLATVSELVESTGLHVAQMDPGDPTAYPRYTLVPIRVAGRGTFTQVLAFLHQLHSGVRDTEVRAFAVHADPNAGSTGVAFELSLAWYAVQGSGPAQRLGATSHGAGRAAGTGRADHPVAGADEN